jgi:predicted nucleic acid-binding protein
MLLNAVVYAELSVRFPTIEALESVPRESGLTMTQIPRPALFLAGKIFLDYRSRGGARTGVLPDFFIGAHAAVSGCDLLTRDPRRYRTYFPNVPVVSP